MHPALVWAPPLVGSVLGRRWKLERLLGAGGMGAVYEAVHEKMGRRAAVKVIAPELRSDPTLIERFRREAYAAGALGIGGVVEVLDFDVDESHGPFLVMELLRGEGLNERLTRVRRLPPAQIVELGASLLDTLAGVHARGIVHRDLKPGNVFFVTTPDGRERLKILDFGISRVHQVGHTMLTSAGSVLGTPRYMSPEQALGAPDVDARADLYGVGAVLYACAAGRAPYADVPDAEVHAAVLAGPPPPIARIAPDVPAALAAVIDRALRAQRRERFADAGEMCDAIRQVHAGGVVARAAEPSGSTGRPRSTPAAEKRGGRGGSGAYGAWVAVFGVSAAGLIGVAVVAVAGYFVFVAPSAGTSLPATGTAPIGPLPSPMPVPYTPPAYLPPLTVDAPRPPGSDVLGPVGEPYLQLELMGGQMSLDDDPAAAMGHFETVLARTASFTGRSEITRARALAQRGLGDATLRQLELERRRRDPSVPSVPAITAAHERASRYYTDSSTTYDDAALWHCNTVSLARAAEVAAEALDQDGYPVSSLYYDTARRVYRGAQEMRPDGVVPTCAEDAILGLSRVTGG